MHIRGFYHFAFPNNQSDCDLILFWGTGFRNKCILSSQFRIHCFSAIIIMLGRIFICEACRWCGRPQGRNELAVDWPRCLQRGLLRMGPPTGQVTASPIISSQNLLLNEALSTPLLICRRKYACFRDLRPLSEANKTIPLRLFIPSAAKLHRASTWDRQMLIWFVDQRARRKSDRQIPHLLTTWILTWIPHLHLLLFSSRYGYSYSSR